MRTSVNSIYSLGVIGCCMSFVSHFAWADILNLVDTGSRTGSFELVFNCNVHYIDHSPRSKTATVEVQLLQASDCQELNASMEPATLTESAIERLESVTTGIRVDNATTLQLSFKEPVIYTVVQGQDLKKITVLTLSINTPVAPTPPLVLPKELSPQQRDNTLALAPDRITNLMQQAHDKLLDAEFDSAIQIYQRLLHEPDTGHHAKALEYLGVAYEKHGLPAQAVTRYQQYLDQFGANADTSADRVMDIQRVSQRLQALAKPTLDVAPTAQQRVEAGPWQLLGSISQDYYATRHELEGFSGSQDYSSLLTFADFSIRHQGSRFTWSSQVNAGYLNDLSKTTTNSGNQTLVANAFLELQDEALGLSTRLGRQTLYRDGVLGRFEGLRSSYRLKDKVRLNLTLGSPVDTMRYAADGNRRFVALSADIFQLLERIDLNLFANFQTNDGLAGRQAIGGQVMYTQDPWRVQARLDYDTSFAVLNSGLLQVDYQANQRLRGYARVHASALPFLTTRNALVGQPFTRLSELENLYSEGQIRTIARNRTADSLQFATGFAALLSDRWYLNADLYYQEIDGAIASAGVAARPSTTQIYSAATFTGSSIFRRGDTAIVGVRYDSTQRANISTLLFELRFPWGSALRVGPKLSLSHQDFGSADESGWWVEPGLRLSYRNRLRYLFEFDVGSRLTQRDLLDNLQSTAAEPLVEERSSELFFNLSWRVEF